MSAAGLQIIDFKGLRCSAVRNSWLARGTGVECLLLAIGMLVHIAIGLRYEERDLVMEFGDTYLDYRRRVGAVLPWVGRSG